MMRKYQKRPRVVTFSSVKRVEEVFPYTMGINFSKFPS
jgi:hypothetical protein